MHCGSDFNVVVLLGVISVLCFHDVQLGMLDKKLAGLFGIGAMNSEKAR